MGQVPSRETITKPVEPTYAVGPWQGAVIMMIGTTLWLGSMDNLPPEAYAFYLVWSRSTMIGIICVIAHRMYQGWIYNRSVEVWNEKQIAAKKAKGPNPGETEFSRKMPFSYWDAASRAHPSAFLTTHLMQPRLFPFPMGLAGPEKESSMYWENGLQPQVGRFKIGGDFDKKKREATVKAISEESKKKDRAEKERGEIYAERRRVVEHRIWHIKIISAILVLAFFSKRIALLALVPLVYSIFRHEMEAILEGKHSTYVQPKKARALKVNKAPEGEPGMAMSYLYQPVGDGLTSLSRAPILENAPVLMTSTDPKLAGAGAKERTVPTWFKYPSESSSSSRRKPTEATSTEA